MKRLLSLILVLVILLGVSPALVPETQAAVSQIDYVYGSSGKYTNVIANWGQRGETATFLSSNAASFYEEQGTSYAQLAGLSGASSRSDVPYSPLYKELQSIMQSAHDVKTSYNDTKNLYKYTDCQNASPTGISSFYSGVTIGPEWGSSPSWNREHTWPNSKGLGGQDENDIMMLRPTATSENSSRGNTAYGESSGYYHPNSESGGKYDLRGDVARIMLYTYVRWGNTGKMWGASGVMESVEVLLEWVEADPVDTWELGRNDSVESITGTRNVFVDYPELIFVMFGAEIPADMPTPSGAAADDTIVPAPPVETEPTEPTEPTPPDYATEPLTGVPYKFRVVQKNLGKTLYLTGAMKGYYYETTENISQAADVYLEAVSGGYRLFMLADGVKTYLEIVKNDTYTNVVFTTSPTKVLKWNDAIASVTCDVNGTDHYFGNYSEYVTFSASKISYVTGDNAASFDETNFVAHFIATDGEPLPEDTTDPTDPTETEPTEPEVTEPEADATLSIVDAAALGATKSHNTFTAEKYYVTGTVTQIKNTTYGNMYIADGEGNTLYVYGVYSADGETRYDKMDPQPAVGDTVTLYGILGQYNGTAQMKNAWVTALNLPDETGKIPGDLDGNEQVSTDDAVALLLHISMPDMFPLPESANADLDGDGAVTTDDAVKLLLHISMPDLFPL